MSVNPYGYMALTPNFNPTPASPSNGPVALRELASSGAVDTIHSMAPSARKEVANEIKALHRRLDIMKEVIKQRKKPEEVVRYLKLIKVTALCYCYPKEKEKSERVAAMQPLLTEVNDLIRRNGGTLSDRQNIHSRYDKWDICSKLWLEMIQIERMQNELDPSYSNDLLQRLKEFKMDINDAITHLSMDDKLVIAECKILLQQVNEKIEELDRPPIANSSAGFRNCLAACIRRLFG